MLIFRVFRDEQIIKCRPSNIPASAIPGWWKCRWLAGTAQQCGGGSVLPPFPRHIIERHVRLPLGVCNCCCTQTHRVLVVWCPHINSLFHSLCIHHPHIEVCVEWRGSSGSETVAILLPHHRKAAAACLAVGNWSRFKVH